MRRLFARISTALGRMAFWRKPAAADEAVALPTANAVPALLSRKIVGIPAIGFALLAVVGTLAALLWQANREHASLEAKLQAVTRTRTGHAG